MSYMTGSWIEDWVLEIRGIRSEGGEERGRRVGESDGDGDYGWDPEREFKASEVSQIFQALGFFTFMLHYLVKSLSLFDPPSSKEQRHQNQPEKKFLLVLGFELRSSQLQGSCFTTWPTRPALRAKWKRGHGKWVLSLWLCLLDKLPSLIQEMLLSAYHVPGTGNIE
jgi:hypothetical protein